jgi:hypothetical protein
MLAGSTPLRLLLSVGYGLRGETRQPSSRLDIFHKTCRLPSVALFPNEQKGFSADAGSNLSGTGVDIPIIELRGIEVLKLQEAPQAGKGFHTI